MTEVVMKHAVANFEVASRREVMEAREVGENQSETQRPWPGRMSRFAINTGHGGGGVGRRAWQGHVRFQVARTRRCVARVASELAPKYPLKSGPKSGR